MFDMWRGESKQIVSMIVFLAGMQRSGSTFSFNIARDLLSRRGSVYQEPSSNAVHAIERSGQSTHVLFKAHQTDDTTIRMIELGSIKVLCTVRRPEDAIASWVETFGFNLEESIEHMRVWLSMYARLRPYAYTLKYDQIDSYPWRAAWNISRYICPDASLVEVISAARAHAKDKVKTKTDAMSLNDTGINDVEFSFYDHSTFFHRRHVSSVKSVPAADRIGHEAVACIRRDLVDFLDKNGDLLLK